MSRSVVNDQEKKKKKIMPILDMAKIQVSGLINLWFLRALFMAYKCVFWPQGPEFHKSILKCYCRFYPWNLFFKSFCLVVLFCSSLCLT